MQMMQKPYTLIIPSWYPSDTHGLNGIFVQKHTEQISTFRNVVVMYITGSDHSYVTEEKVSESYIKYVSYYKESGSKLYNQVKYISAQIRAYRYLSTKYGIPELLHLHVVFPAGILVYLLLLFKNIQLIITEHWTGYMDEDGRYEKLPGFAQYVTRVLFDKAKKVALVSGYFREILLQKKLVAPEKIMTVYNRLNMPVSIYDAADSKMHKALYIGNLIDDQKNITMLIHAVGSVVQRYPDFTLSLVGGGAETDKFKKLAADKGLLDKNIIFRGFVANSQLEPVYHEHGFFILTSNFETFNIAAAEAMLSGLPVVSTRCGGPTEFINPHTGIWIENKTAKGTARAIIAMIERRREFDSAAIARETQEKFSDATILSQLKDLYSL